MKLCRHTWGRWQPAKNHLGITCYEYRHCKKCHKPQTKGVKK